MDNYIGILVRDLKKKEFYSLIEDQRKFGSKIEQVEKNLIVFSNGDIRIVNCLFKLRETHPEIRFGISQYIGLAKGLAKIAKFGEILISEDVEQSLLEHYQITSLGMLSIEGLKTQILVCRIDAPTGRVDFPPIKPVFSFIPRTGMVEALRDTLKVIKWILIFGPPGSGKSVFIDQFIENLDGEYEIFKVQCHSYIPHITFKLIVDLVHQILNIDENATIEEKYKIIEKRLKEIGIIDIGTTYLATLDCLGISDEDTILKKMELKMRLEVVASSISEIIRQMSHQKPVMIIIEDVENIDPSSSEFIQAIMKKLTDDNVWFLFTSHLSQVNIGGLREFELLEIERGLVEDYVAKNIGELLNFPPTSIFHIDQYLRLYEEERLLYFYNQYLGESPMMDYHLPFYDLKTIIKRRIEILGENKELLFNLAVFGEKINLKEFPGGDEKNLFEIFLQKNYLTRVSGGYTFISPLLHEEIYNLIPDRPARHSRLADYYRRLEGYEEYAAFHYERAENYKMAIEFLTKSARLAFAKGGYNSAINYYNKALELCRRDKSLAELETLVSINEGLADIYRALGDEERALKYYKVVLDSYKEILKE
uniref:Orc1-like AAA ATPase domain-containing protein n=1 Tax=candidate division WOR-3 bacterium TaxID=2052148 RepID=A0A7C4TI22_UNCW3